MEQTRQMGRWIRVTAVNGYERVINLDQVAYLTKPTDTTSRVWFENHDSIDVAEPFDDFALRVMVGEYQTNLMQMPRYEPAA